MSEEVIAIAQQRIFTDLIKARISGNSTNLTIGNGGASSAGNSTHGQGCMCNQHMMAAQQNSAQGAKQVAIRREKAKLSVVTKKLSSWPASGNESGSDVVKKVTESPTDVVLGLQYPSTQTGSKHLSATLQLEYCSRATTD